MSGLSTRNESRTMVDLNELGDVGDVFLVPINLVPQMRDDEPIAPISQNEPQPDNEEPNGTPESVPERPEPKGINPDIRWTCSLSV